MTNWSILSGSEKHVYGVHQRTMEDMIQLENKVESLQLSLLITGYVTTVHIG